MKVCVLQLESQTDKAANLAQAEKLLRESIAATKPDLVVMPEIFTYRGGTVEGARESAEEVPGGSAWTLLQGIAKEFGVYLHGGSINERDDDRYYNTTLVFDPRGREVARYRKIHLFDVVTPDGVEYKESATYSRGDEVVTFAIGERTVGLSICYDLRFPELYGALRRAGADVIVVPAAFTLLTGKDHWEVLCRARAIETQAYVLAANQDGSYVEAGIERASYGHSMIVDPWGTVLARAQPGAGYIAASLDLGYLENVRSKLPSNAHHVLDAAAGAP